MSKDKIADYDGSTAGNNTDIGGISIAEGMLPSAVNNSMRELTKQLGAFSDGTDGIDVLNLHDDDASASIKIQAPSAVTTTTTLTLPDGDGDAGAMLQTNGSGQLAWSTAYRNRNIVINGSQIVAQRGTSTSSISSGDTYPSVDRFMLRVSSAGTWTHSQSTDAPAGFSSSLKMDCTAADASLSADDNVQVQYRFEGQDLQQLDFGSAGAKSLTLSFWIKATKTGTNIVELYQDDGNDHIAKSYTVDSANTWEHKTITFSGNTLASIANDNTRGLIVQFFLAAGSNFQSGTLATSWAGYVQGNEAVGQVNHADSTSNDWYITGIQLEVGEQATPFEHRSYGEELAACQRYFTKSYNQGTAVATATVVGSVYKVMDAAMNYGTENVVFPCSMRATPTVGIYSPVTGALGKFDSNTSGGTTDLNLVAVNIGDHGFSGQSNNQAVGVNAYMRWHYTADAEL